MVLALPAARTWSALASAYNVLNIPIVAYDSTTRTISGATSAYRQFHKSPVSRFVDCGSTLVGPNADTHRVELRLETRVVPESDSSSTLRTRLDASGTGSTSAVNCATTGALEKLVNDQVTTLLEQAK